MQKRELENELLSNRRYSEKQCANKDCDFGRKFIPHDRRQRFCCSQCRINFHNDQRHNANNGKLANEKRLRDGDKRLERIYLKFVDQAGYCAVWKGILEYEEIDLRLSVTEQANTTTAGRVKWLYTYGTEIHPKNKEYFIIHKKPSL